MREVALRTFREEASSKTLSRRVVTFETREYHGVCCFSDSVRSCGVSKAFEQKRGALQPACVRGLSGAGKGRKGSGHGPVHQNISL